MHVYGLLLPQRTGVQMRGMHMPIPAYLPTRTNQHTGRKGSMNDSINMTDYEDDHEEMSHEHGPLCFAHNEHWRDDSMYVAGEEHDESDDIPTVREMVKLLGEMEGDEHVRKFALIYVNGDGVIQCVSNPGQTPNTVMNLLANGIRIMAFQEHMMEQTADAMLAKGIVKVRGIPNDLFDMLGIKPRGKHRKGEEKDEEIKDVRTAGPYL